MNILINIVLFLAGVAIGGYFVYKYEKKQIDDLIIRCNETSKRMEDMLKQEEDFIESIWPKSHHNITMGNNLADYLKTKYLSEETEASRRARLDEANQEDRDWSDCEDESDNLYV